MHGPEFFDLLHLAEEVFEIEVGLAHFLGHFLGFLLVDVFLGFFDEGNDIAHAENPGSHAVGVKALEVFGFFADTGVADGDSGDGFHGEGGTAAGISVEFGQDYAGEIDGFVKVLGNVDGFLSEGAVGDEENFVGDDGFAQILNFFDEVFVDLEASGGVEEEGIVAVVLGVLEGVFTDFGDFFVVAFGVKSEGFLSGELFQLVDRGGAVHIAGDEEGAVPVGGEPAAHLGTGGGFSGPVQADHHNPQGFLFGDLRAVSAEELDEFIVDDFDDLLPGGDGFGDFLADAFFFHLVDEIAGDAEMNIGGEQGGANFLEGVGHVLFGQFSFAAEVAKGVGEFIGKAFKHDYCFCKGLRPRRQRESRLLVSLPGSECVRGL